MAALFLRIRKKKTTKPLYWSGRSWLSRCHLQAEDCVTGLLYLIALKIVYQKFVTKRRLNGRKKVIWSLWYDVSMEPICKRRLRNA